jgi:DNA end-binding protein Ku
MAEQLIESFTGEFDPSRYEDTYRDALCEIIRAKRKGEEVHVPERAEEEEQAPDLLSALRASVEAAQGRRGGRKARANGGDGNGDLAKLSKEELYERAKELDVRGRADMTKDELVEALEAAA